MRERLNKLQLKNVFIHIEPEHYKNGSNACFSIEFRDYGEQTGWYGDNHEFGEFGDVMYAALELAEWYLEDDNRIKAINAPFNDFYVREERDKKVFSLMKNPNI